MKVYLFVHVWILIVLMISAYSCNKAAKSAEQDSYANVPGAEHWKRIYTVLWFLCVVAMGYQAGRIIEAALKL